MIEEESKQETIADNLLSTGGMNNLAQSLNPPSSRTPLPVTVSQFLRICDRDVNVEGRLIRTARIDGEKYLFLDHPELLLKGLRNCGTRVDLFTFIQKLSNTSPGYPYPMELDNFAALPISTFENWWTKQIGFKARNKAKQAEKHGVTLKEVPFSDKLIQGIWEIYNETPIRQGKRFPHYGISIEQVHKYAGTFLDRSVFIGAYLEDKLIGFAKLTIDETRTQAGLMHIVSMIGQRDKAPTNALVAQAVRSCAERRIPYLIYSNFAYGKKRSDSLSDFKERNGFQRMDVPRYYVPLTPLGWIFFHLGLHHKLIDRIPESFIAKLRDLRSAWYNRKSTTSAVSL